MLKRERSERFYFLVNRENPLPPHESISALANDFNSFFVGKMGKIEKMRSKLDALREMNFHSIWLNPRG